MDELDNRLRALAHESLDRAEADVSVDDDLAAVRARAADRTTVVPEPRPPWSRLAVAATLVLVAAGAVAILATRDVGEEAVAPSATELSQPETSASIVPPVDRTALAIVEPSIAAPGSVVTITPSSTVRSRCPGGAEVYLAETTEVLGWIEPGERLLVRAPLVDRDLTTCETALSAEAQDVLVPDDMPPGRYRVCIDEDASASGCAVLEVEAGRPTTSVASEIPLATAEPQVVGVGWRVTITPAGEVRRTCQDIVSVARRTERGFAPLGQVVPTSSGTDGWDTSTPTTIPACDGARTADPLEVRVPSALEAGEYRFCIAGDDVPEGCALVDVRGVLMNTTSPTSPTTTIAPAGALPVGYFERVDVDAPPYFEIRQVSADGTLTSTLAAAELELLMRREVPVGAGGSVRLLPEEQPYGRCDARQVVSADPTTEVPPGLAVAVRSLVATADGVVVVGVDVCPEGAQWGDEGTRFELRRIDLSTGVTTVLHVREPGDGDTFFEDPNVVYAGGEFVVESVSPDGTYVAVAEPYTTEDIRYHVLDAVTDGEPLTFESVCDDPRDVVGPPQFVGDGLVVLARECSPVDGGTGDLIVELVSIETRAPVWSVDVDHVAIDSYSSTVQLDAGEFDGRVWALVSGSAGIELPIRAAAVTGGTELPLPGGSLVAFTPEELIEPWDPYPA